MGKIKNTILAVVTLISFTDIKCNDTLVVGSGKDIIFHNIKRDKQQSISISKKKHLRSYEDNYVYSLAFNPNGKTLAVGLFTKGVELLNVKKMISGETETDSIGILKIPGDTVIITNSVAFNKNGKILASASSDGMIRLWKVKFGTSSGSWRVNETKPLTIATSIAFGGPDGKILASGSHDETVKLWNVETGKLMATLEKHGSAVYCVAFSPNGKILASGSGDKTIKLWDIKRNKSGEITTKLIKTKKYRDSVNCLAFSPNGKVLASGAGQKVVLWDISKKNPEKFTVNFDASVRSVAFNSTGSILVAGASEPYHTKIILLDMKTKKMCSLKKRQITNFPVLTFQPKPGAPYKGKLAEIRKTEEKKLKQAREAKKKEEKTFLDIEIITKK